VLDEAAPPVSSARGAFRSQLGRFVLELLSTHQVELIAALWFVIALTTMLYEWGLNPLVFQAQDEAVVRFAAALISQHGHCSLSLPFPDPEDMAHPRSWVSQGATALPIYAPVLLYSYGLLLRLRTLGLLLIQILPAVAVAVFAAGSARLLPAPRRWLALLAPLLGFASLYWVLRPWMNLSSVIACSCWAFFFWTLWVETDQHRWLAATLLSVGVASAVRPDYAGFLLISAVLFMVAGNPQRWRHILLWSVVAGVCAVVPNLILNKATTGHALRAVYQIALDREYGADATHGLDGAHGFRVSSVLNVLFTPMGIPDFSEFSREFKKYFVHMGPSFALLLGQLALIPILRKKSLVSRFCYLAVVAFAAFFVVSRLHSQVFGGPERHGYVHHSVPRYVAPVFLFMALPPLLFLGQCRDKWTFYLGTALLCAVAVDSSYELYVKQQCSFTYMRGWVHANAALVDAVTPEIPKNAMVYSAKLDKLLWSRWPVGFIDDDPEHSAASLSRAADAGLPVFVLEPKPARQLRRIMTALKRRGLALLKIDAKNGLYRLDKET
jgi:hypothetical protein